MSESLVEALKKIEARDAGVAVIWFLSVIGSGFLTVFLFLPEVAKDFDFLKLIVLSASLSLPVVAFNLFVFYCLALDHERNALPAHWIAASATSMLSFYASLYAAYYFSLSFPNFALLLFLANLAVTLSLAAILRYGGKQVPS